jgi:hypothetical protein
LRSSGNDILSEGLLFKHHVQKAPGGKVLKGISGGKGKDKLYDDMLPKHLNEIGKRYGVQLEKRTNSLWPIPKYQTNRR